MAVPKSLRYARAHSIFAGLIGVGIDIEHPARFSHLGEPVLRRAAARWLSPDERAWCALQTSCHEAMLVVLSCKEALYKAWPGIGVAHELRLAIRGSTARGRAAADRCAPVRLEAAWRGSGGTIVTLAVAGRFDEADGLLECLLDESARRLAALRLGPRAGSAPFPSRATAGVSSLDHRKRI